MIDILKPILGKFTSYAQDKMGFRDPPRLFLKKDKENACKVLGKTAHYDPGEKAITIFINNRHPKDILRSFSHELVHHVQNLRGDLSPEKCGQIGPGYAQNNDHMRNMEKEAYLVGNLCFRDWEDSLDNKLKYQISIAEEKFIKENKQMTTREKKTVAEITGLGDMAYQAGDKPELTTLEAEAMVRTMIDMFSDNNDAFGVMQTLDKMGPEFGRGQGNLGGEAMSALKNVYDALLKANDRFPGQPGNPYPQNNQKLSESKLVKENKKMTKKITKKLLKETIGKILSENPAFATGVPPMAGDADKAAHISLEPDTERAPAPKSVAEFAKGLLDLLRTKEDEKTRINNLLAYDAAHSWRFAEDGLKDETIEEGEGGGCSGCDNPECECNKVSEDVRANKLQNQGGKLKKPVTTKSDMKKASEEFERKAKAAQTDESIDRRIHTPEQENKLYESRFTPRNNRIFEELVKKWAK